MANGHKRGNYSYARVENVTFRKNIGESRFFHSWDDGWTACVTLTRMPAAEARKLERKSKGFCGYDWMIKSIINYGDIRYLGKEN